MIIGTEAFETLGSGMSAQLAFAGVSRTWAYILYFRFLVTVGATNLSLVTFPVLASAEVLGIVVLDKVSLSKHLAATR